MHQLSGGTVTVIGLLVAAVAAGVIWQAGIVGGGRSTSPGAVSAEVAQAGSTVAQANFAAAAPAIQAFFADHGTYEGLGDPVQGLAHYDASAPGTVVVASATASSYCVQTTAGTQTFSQRGPGGDIVPGPC